MTSCTVARRRRCRQAVGTLETYDDLVESADVHAPDEGHRDGWTVEIVLHGAEIPPTVLDALAAAELSLLPGETGTRAQPVTTTVLARAN
jgi:hypothetical protein